MACAVRHALHFALIPLACLASVVPSSAQYPGANVNLVSGKGWPGGDPFLQRQNEPTVAVSTRNPMHLMAGANDYRTVDLPGLPDDRETGDAWLGVFTSHDGGATWRSTLLPGYPQEDGSTSPLHGYDAGADPTVRAGTNGLLYYSGIVFDRDNPVLLAKSGRTPKPQLAGVGSATSAVFMARYVDNNQKENGESIAYLGTSLVASNASDPDVFLDKPWLAVDIPRRAAPRCTINQSIAGKSVTQSFPAGYVYVAFSRFRRQTGGEFAGEVVFTRSTDCGVTWSPPVPVSAGHKVNQGASVAVDPRTGTVYVAWRRFAWPRIAGGAQQPAEQPDAILIARSLDRGRTFGPPELVANLQPFDQGSASTRFRTNDYPSVAVDRHGRVYVVFVIRGAATGSDSRVVLSSVVYPSRARVKFTDEDDTPETAKGCDPKVTWPAAAPIDPDTSRRGHQIMPAALISGSMLQVAYVDFQDDHTWGEYEPDASGVLVESRVASDERRDHSEDVFRSDRVDDQTVHSRRHTADVFVAQARVGASPAFAIRRVSRYRAGIRPEEPLKIQQLQFNPPNLPLFKRGTTPFFGDYVDAGAQAFDQKNRNKWRHAPKDAPSFVVFTDNRDVRPPLDGRWDLYTPPVSAALGDRSLFDPSQTPPPCDVSHPERAGMRNQNVYGARVSRGLVVGVPGNAKPLGRLQRAFVVFVENTTYAVRSFRLTIAKQPAGGSASFGQFGALTSLDLTIAPRSSATRTVYVSSSDRRAEVVVNVQETGGGIVVPPGSGGLESAAVINPDMTNPDMTNPDMTNPDMTNADVLNVEVHTPDMTNPDMTNPDMTNAGVVNPDMTNPDMTNPDMTNPDMTNPDVVSFNPANADVATPDMTNPDMTNPDMTNPDMTNASMTDTIWTVTNVGNTTSAYDVRLLARDASLPEGFKTQLMIYRTYETPVAYDCQLVTQTQNVLLATIPDPPIAPVGGVVGFDPRDGSLQHATLWLAPGESAKVALRVLDPDKTDGVRFDPLTSVTLAAIAQAVDTTEAAAGVRQPTPVMPPAPLLSFDQGPSSTPIGGLISPPVRVLLRDENGDGMAGVTVVLSIASGPAGAAVHGGSAVTGPDGRATFPSLYLDRVGTGYTLRATAGTASAVSGAFDVLPLIVTTVDDIGPGSLREAITNANRNAGYADVVSFAIPGAGPYTISPSGALPSLTDPVTIDAATQPGYAGVPVVELDGVAAGGGAGLSITGGGTTVRGLAIGRFYWGVRIDGGGENVIEGCFIGTDTLGTAARANGAEGVLVSSSSGNRIGGSTPAERNLLSGNGLGAVRIAGVGSNGNKVLGNYIGTDVTGGVLIGPGQIGIRIEGAVATVVSGNVIAGGLFGIYSSSGGRSSLIQGNRIGTNAAGTQALGNEVGINIVGGSDNVIGGPDPAQRNLISGSSIDCMQITDSDRNRVEGNYIGTNLAGTAAIVVPRVTGGGIGVSGAENVVIGNVISGTGQTGVGMDSRGGCRIEANLIGTNAAGTAAIPNRTGLTFYGASGANDVIRDNVISGSDQFGVALGSVSRLIVAGNRIGTDVTGTIAIPNATTVFVPAVEIFGCFDSVIGGVTAAEANVVSGNLGDGVRFRVETGAGIANCRVQGNRIGTTSSGAGALGNAGTGVYVMPTGGGLMPIAGLALDGNVISGNGGHGVLLGDGTHDVVLSGNRIGTNLTGATAIANSGNGVRVMGAGTSAVVIDGNLVAGNAQNGVLVDTNAHDVRITGNRIGTNDAGTGAIANGGNGVLLGMLGYPAAQVTVGGTTASARNVISGNAGAGVSLDDSSDVTIQGNYVGTNASGTLAVPNTGQGIAASDSYGLRIGGAETGAANVISGNGGVGVSLAHNVGAQVLGNRIGTDAAGVLAVPNGSHGVSIGGMGAMATIGSADPLGGNVISGNGGAGVDTWITVGSATLVGNSIGTDATGSSAIPNQQGGVRGGHSTTIGTAAAGEGNVISGNRQFGIRLDSSNAVVRGNRIGTDATGAFAVPNLGHGVWLTGTATNNVVGASEAAGANTIAHNQGDGIRDTADAGTTNAFGSNDIHSNTGLGIDLGGDGVTANDTNDADTGPNGLLNSPVIVSAVDDGTTSTVTGTLDIEPLGGVDVVIHFFTSSSCDPSGFGQGAGFLRGIVETTDSSGHVSFSAQLPPGLAGQVLTATATASYIVPGGRTSEFSSCFAVGP